MLEKSLQKILFNCF